MTGSVECVSLPLPLLASFWKVLSVGFGVLWGFISRGSQCAQDWDEKENSGLGRNYRRSWSCTDLGNAGGRRLLSAVFDICKVDIP